MKRVLHIDLVRFGLVGALGFAINFILLSILYRLSKVEIFFAQLIAGEIALFCTFLLHNSWTYKHKKVTKSILTLLWQFHATSWVAILGNAIIVGFLVSTLHFDYMVALALTAIVTLGWNFVWTKFVIWRHEEETMQHNMAKQ